MLTKRCPGCEQTLPVDAFSMRSGGRYRRSRCRPCEVTANRGWAERNPEKAALVQRRRDLRARYGLELEDYEQRLAAQGGGCAICRATEPGGGRRYFDVDHDHRTGAVRGLLCSPCNAAMGLLGDDPARLEAAATYLRGSRC